MDVSIWVAIISAAAAIGGALGASIIQAYNLRRRQTRDSEDFQVMAKPVLESQRLQETQGSRQTDLMMRAASEFSDSTERLASVADVVLDRLVCSLNYETTSQFSKPAWLQAAKYEHGRNLELADP
jgi:hypothetical protein